MGKIYIKDVKITREMAKQFSWEDRLACCTVWENLLAYSDDSKKFDATWEVGQALAIANKPYSGNGFEVYKVEAEFAPNCRLESDYYAYQSGNMDVWFTVKAWNQFDGFYSIGFYLSDIWQVCATEASINQCREHMLIRRYMEI